MESVTLSGLGSSKTESIQSVQCAKLSYARPQSSTKSLTAIVNADLVCMWSVPPEAFAERVVEGQSDPAADHQSQCNPPPTDASVTCHLRPYAIPDNFTHPVSAWVSESDVGMLLLPYTQHCLVSEVVLVLSPHLVRDDSRFRNSALDSTHMKITDTCLAFHGVNKEQVLSAVVERITESVSSPRIRVIHRPHPNAHASLDELAGATNAAVILHRLHQSRVWGCLFSNSQFCWASDAYTGPSDLSSPYLRYMYGAFTSVSSGAYWAAVITPIRSDVPPSMPASCPNGLAFAWSNPLRGAALLDMGALLKNSVDDNFKVSNAALNRYTTQLLSKVGSSSTSTTTNLFPWLHDMIFAASLDNHISWSHKRSVHLDDNSLSTVPTAAQHPQQPLPRQHMVQVTISTEICTLFHQHHQSSLPRIRPYSAPCVDALCNVFASGISTSATYLSHIVDSDYTTVWYFPTQYSYAPHVNIGMQVAMSDYISGIAFVFPLAHNKVAHLRKLLQKATLQFVFRNNDDDYLSMCTSAADHFSTEDASASPWTSVNSVVQCNPLTLPFVDGSFVTCEVKASQHHDVHAQMQSCAVRIHMGRADVEAAITLTGQFDTALAIAEATVLRSISPFPRPFSTVPVSSLTVDMAVIVPSQAHDIAYRTLARTTWVQAGSKVSRTMFVIDLTGVHDPFVINALFDEAAVHHDILVVRQGHTAFAGRRSGSGSGSASASASGSSASVDNVDRDLEYGFSGIMLLNTLQMLEITLSYKYLVRVESSTMVDLHHLGMFLRNITTHRSSLSTNMHEFVCGTFAQNSAVHSTYSDCSIFPPHPLPQLYVLSRHVASHIAASQQQLPWRSLLSQQQSSEETNRNYETFLSDAETLGIWLAGLSVSRVPFRDSAVIRFDNVAFRNSASCQDITLALTHVDKSQMASFTQQQQQAGSFSLCMSPAPLSSVQSPGSEADLTVSQHQGSTAVEAAQHFQHYIDTIQNPMLARMKGSPEDMASVRVIVHHSYDIAGLGNRLSAIATAFMVAFASNRALLVCWPHNDKPTDHPSGESVAMPPITDFVQTPFDWDCHSEANFNFWSKAKSRAAIDDLHPYLLQQWRYFDFEHGFQQSVLELVQCLDSVELLMQNSYAWPRLRDAFGDRPYHTIMRQLLKPSTPIEIRLANILELDVQVPGGYSTEREYSTRPLSHSAVNNLAGDAVSSLQRATHASAQRFVAVHIRRPAVASSPDRSKWTTRREIETAIQCTWAILRRHPHLQVYVASDSAIAQDRFASAFGSQIFQHAAGTRASSTGVLDAYAEMMLLSRAHSLVMFGRSTFSQMASAYRDQNVYVVNGNDCMAMQSHYPFAEYRSPVILYRQLQLNSALAQAQTRASELPALHMHFAIFDWVAGDPNAKESIGLRRASNTIAFAEDNVQPANSVAHYTVFHSCRDCRLDAPSSHIKVVYVDGRNRDPFALLSGVLQTVDKHESVFVMNAGGSLPDLTDTSLYRSGELITSKPHAIVARSCTIPGTDGNVQLALLGATRAILQAMLRVARRQVTSSQRSGSEGGRSPAALCEQMWYHLLEQVAHHRTQKVSVSNHVNRHVDSTALDCTSIGLCPTPWAVVAAGSGAAAVPQSSSAHMQPFVLRRRVTIVSYVKPGSVSQLDQVWNLIASTSQGFLDVHHVEFVVAVRSVPLSAQLRKAGELAVSLDRVVRFEVVESQSGCSFECSGDGPCSDVQEAACMFSALEAVVKLIAQTRHSDTADRILFLHPSLQVTTPSLGGSGGDVLLQPPLIAVQHPMSLSSSNPSARQAAVTGFASDAKSMETLQTAAAAAAASEHAATTAAASVTFCSCDIFGGSLATVETMLTSINQHIQLTLANWASDATHANKVGEALQSLLSKPSGWKDVPLWSAADVWSAVFLNAFLEKYSGVSESNGSGEGIAEYSILPSFYAYPHPPLDRHTSGLRHLFGADDAIAPKAEIMLVKWRGKA
jgi:hypothetical protein